MKKFENLTPPEKEFIPFTRNFELEKHINKTVCFLSGKIHFKAEDEIETEIDLYEVVKEEESYLKTSNPSKHVYDLFQSMIDEIDISDDSDYYKCE